MYGTGMPDIKYVPRSRTDQTRLTYGTGMPRRGDALYIYILEINMARRCLISGLFN